MARFDLNLLGPLEALLTERHVTRAAIKLNVSQPTMSGMLQRLRYQFDDELLVRSGRDLALTAFARTLVGPARNAIANVESLMTIGRNFDPAQEVRRFSIAAPESCAGGFVGALCEQLATEAPGITINLEPTGQQGWESLRDGTVDFLITSDPLSQPIEGVADTFLLDDELKCVIDRRHAVLRESAETELARYRYFTVGRVPRFAWPGAGVADNDVDPVVSTDSLYVAIKLIQGKDMVGVMSGQLAEALAAVCPVQIFALPLVAERLRYRVYWNAQQEKDPANRWMRDAIVARAKALRSVSDRPSSNVTRFGDSRGSLAI